MALSSQGGLDFHQSRLQDSTESARGALTEFGSLAQRFQDNKLKAEALAEAKAQQAIENARADRAEAMQKEQFEMRKKEFDTMQNTLRATALGTTTLDKAAVGQALLDKQASTLNKTLDDRIASLAAKNNMTVDQFNASGGMQKAVEAGAFKDLTGVTGTGMEDTAPLSGGSMAKQAEAMLGANAKNMQVQKQLIGEVGNQYFKEGEDGPMLYDPTSLNKYKHDLLQGLDTRIDREATRAQADEHLRLQLAQSERQFNKRMAAEKTASDKMLARLKTNESKRTLFDAMNADYYGFKPKEAYTGSRDLYQAHVDATNAFKSRQAQLNAQWNKLHPENIVMTDGKHLYPKYSKKSGKTYSETVEDYQKFMNKDKELAGAAESIKAILDVRTNPQKYGLSYNPNQERVYDSSQIVAPSREDVLARAAYIRTTPEYLNASYEVQQNFEDLISGKRADYLDLLGKGMGTTSDSITKPKTIVPTEQN